MKKSENNLYYEEEGYSNDELIIFLHSNLLSNWIWKNQRTSFEDYHCIYLDLPNHGNSYFNTDFSIENSGELIKDLIEKKSIAESKSKKVHLVGVSVGGQIILYLLAKYPELIDTAVITGVNLYGNFKKESITDIITLFDRLKLDILDKKSNKFLIKALLAEYGLEKEYYNDLEESTEKIINNNININDNSNSNSNSYSNSNSNSYSNSNINSNNSINNTNNNINNNFKEKNNEKKNNENIYNNIYNYNLNNITKESLEFKIPESKHSKSNNNNNNNNNNNLLVLYGTKEYPKIQKSANLIKSSFKNAKIFSVYRSIHLWNIIDYEWFNETVKDFITNKSIDLDEKPYLKKIDN